MHAPLASNSFLSQSLPFCLFGLLTLSACGPKTADLLNKDKKNQTDQPQMEAEAAKLSLAEFDLTNTAAITPEKIAKAAEQISFPKTILLGPGTATAMAVQIAGQPIPGLLAVQINKTTTTECDQVMPALDTITGIGETLTFDFGYDYSVCAKKEWEKDGSRVDQMKYQVSQHFTLTCPGADYSAVNGKTLQELESAKLTGLLSCNYNGASDIGYTFKLLFVTIASGADKEGVEFSADQRVSKILAGSNGLCTLKSANNIVTVQECFQNDRAKTTVSGFGAPSESGNVIGRVNMAGFSASRNVRYYSGTNPAAMQINNWVGTATFDGTAEAAFSLSNGTDTYAASLIP